MAGGWAISERNRGRAVADNSEPDAIHCRSIKSGWLGVHDSEPMDSRREFALGLHDARLGSIDAAGSC